MAEARVERRLAAILAADVSGYSRLMDADELVIAARSSTPRLMPITAASSKQQAMACWSSSPAPLMP
jgi:adenylate cyclase